MFQPPGPDADDVDEIYTLLDVLVAKCAIDLVVPILGLILDWFRNIDCSSGAEWKRDFQWRTAGLANEQPKLYSAT